MWLKKDTVKLFEQLLDDSEKMLNKEAKIHKFPYNHSKDEVTREQVELAVVMLMNMARAKITICV